MKMLLHLMESQNNDVLIASLHTLGRIVRSTEMKACWSNFLELILLKIIDCYKISKEVRHTPPMLATQVSLCLLIFPCFCFGLPPSSPGVTRD